MNKRIKPYLHSLVSIALIVILFLTGIFGLVTTSYAQSPWIQKTDMPKERWGHSSISMDGKIYVIGGTGTYRDGAMRAMVVYDPTLDSWTPKAAMLEGRIHFALCEVNGKIYAFGGGDDFYRRPTNTIEEYDPVTDTWTYIMDMPRKRLAHTVSFVDGKIYVIGGADSDLECIAEVDVYDTLTSTWTTVSDLPTPRWSLATVVMDGKIYAVGGALGLKDGESGLTTLEVYDPATDTWTTKASMHTRRKYLSACSLDGKIYVFGGTSGYFTPSLSSVEAYDPETDTWTSITSMPSVLVGHSVDLINEKAYIIGGNLSPPPVIIVSTNYEYTPQHDLINLIENFSVNKSYAKPGSDSVIITTKMSDTAGITLFAVMETPNGNFVDSLQLFDDGHHNDGNASDSLYANTWYTNASEQYCHVNMHVTRIEIDTVNQIFDKVASFTTIGPVTLEEYSFYADIVNDDTIPSPGDWLQLKLTLKNNSSMAIATNIAADLISLDTLISFYFDYNNCSFQDIPAGESLASDDVCWIKISEECPIGTEVPIVVNISSYGNICWSDTLFITVVQEERGTNIENFRAPVIRIYPNPTNDVLTVETGDIGHYSIEITSLNGQLMYNKEIEGTSHQINLSSFQKGIYLITIRSNDFVTTKKIIKL